MFGDSPSARDDVVRVVGGVIPLLTEPVGTSEKVLLRTGRGTVEGEKRTDLCVGYTGCVDGETTRDDKIPFPRAVHDDTLVSLGITTSQ